MSGHRHVGGPNSTQNQGNQLGDRPCVRQSKTYRRNEGGNAMKALLGQDHLQWDVHKVQGSYEGEAYDPGAYSHASGNKTSHPQQHQLQHNQHHSEFEGHDPTHAPQHQHHQQQHQHRDHQNVHHHPHEHHFAHHRSQPHQHQQQQQGRKAAGNAPPQFNFFTGEDISKK